MPVVNSYAEKDPFALFMQPPPNETEAQRMAREARQLDEQQRSKQIDQEIAVARKMRLAEKNIVNVLLLGQAESGKSTTLKNFRMQYDRAAWNVERQGWRSIVQFNIVRAIILILDILDQELAASSNNLGHQFTDRHRLLMIKLSPLRAVEADLRRRIGVGADSLSQSQPMNATPFDEPYTISDPTREVSVRSWHDVVHPHLRKVSTGEHTDDLDSATIIIAECKEYMKSLVEDPVVRMSLDRRRIQLPDFALFFLGELDRIAVRNYVVLDDDIVRARMRTVGIQEYQLSLNGSFMRNGQLTDRIWKWRMYDVGGCRTCRAAWLPFFENVSVIIFLCPISAFDEQLDEDPRISRLQDSVDLWKSICSSNLLAKTQLILFFNKCDLLASKLKRLQLNSYVKSYGERPNEIREVVQYFNARFKDVHKKYSPIPRSYYHHRTTVTDTKATAKTLESVRDGVLRENLGNTQLI